MSQSVEDFLAHITTDQRNNAQDKAQTLPDGSFPIRNIKDLGNAIKSFGLAKDKAQAKSWIMKRAKELNAEQMLPKQWVAHEDSEGETFFSKRRPLTHHGVMGMRWGHRKARGGSISVPHAGRTPTHSDRAHVDELKKKPNRTLSNSELETVRRRLQLEQNVSQLKAKQGSINRGHEFAKTALAVGTTAASLYALSQSPAGKAFISAGKKYATSAAA